MTAPAGIVLAAGESRRMGRPKALLQLGGICFVDRVLDSLAAGGVEDLEVVLGHDPEAVRAGARLAGARVVINPDYALGQFSSVRCGIQALPPGTPAVVVALVDHPLVPGETVESLIAAFAATGAPIVRPVWQGRGGHPVLFSAETFEDFRALPPSATTLDIVSRYRSRRIDVTAADDSILIDVDTPADLERLEARLTGGRPPA